MKTVELRIDQRPARIEQVSDKIYKFMLRLGWFEDGRARLI